MIVKIVHMVVLSLLALMFLHKKCKIVDTLIRGWEVRDSEIEVKEGLVKVDRIRC